MYYAHSNGEDNKSKWQPLKEHLELVAQKAEEFSQKADIEKLGFVAGLLHDLGKYSSKFQRRLEGDKIRVDHSTAGAIEAEKLYGKPWGRVLAYIVAGHHAGIPNDVSLNNRLKKRDIPDYFSYIEEIQLPSLGKMERLLVKFKDEPAFSISFFIRIMYSCLVDADFLDTEKAFGSQHHSIRQKYKPPLSYLLSRLELYLYNKINNSPATPINLERQVILEACRNKAKNPPGLFSLTVPTGGGKTLSSMDFSLRHATYNKMDRIIYVIPYSSIIEQNAQVFREALGEDAVLEHHSNYPYPDESFDEWSEDAKRHRLSAENWDMPVVVTTSVQFFESLFANRSSRCRKLHNMINSVIIFDEAQMIPTDYLQPCLFAITELVKNYKSTVVFCTATQPAVSGLLPGNLDFTEIISDPKSLYERFQRVKVKDVQELTDDELVDKIKTYHQVLCIVNTRRHARKLFDQISEIEGTYHLSARMCPAHRTQKLSEIREALKQELFCRVISTQLIEAGVDVDFPTVYRASTGIDSIVQAAGRCNREGKRLYGDVFVFRPEKHGLPSGWFSRVASLGNITLRQYPNSPISLEAVEHYFSNLYSFEGERLDSKGILKSLEEGWRDLWFPFEDIAKNFKLIDQDMQPIIVPFDYNARELMYEVETSMFPGSLARSLQAYTVQVYSYELMALTKNRIVRRVADLYWFLEDSSFYSDSFGLLEAKEVVVPKEVLMF